MATQSVKVNNVSLSATKQDLKEFFTFSGEIESIELHRDNDCFQVAYITFKKQEEAETSVLLSGSMVAGQPITITLAPDYTLPPSTTLESNATEIENTKSNLQKAEDVVSSMLAKGFILGKDVLNRAKSFDEKHQLTSIATTKVISLDQKIGLSEKITASTTLVNDKVKEMDERFQVSEKTKSALSVAEQSVSNAGSTIMKNRYVLTGATWVIGAFSKVTKAANDVGQKTKDKVLAEKDQGKPKSYADASGPQFEKPTKVEQPSKTTTTQGLIL